LRVGRGEKVSRGLVWLAWITGEVIPNAVKIDTFPPRDQPFRVRSVKVEMPDTGALQYVAPWIDSRNPKPLRCRSSISVSMLAKHGFQFNKVCFNSVTDGYQYNPMK
jgi:hypothetical protein